MTRQDFIDLGWRDMSELNPKEMYHGNTFGYRPEKSRNSLFTGYVSAFYLRFYQDGYVQVWTQNPPQNVFTGKVDNKTNFSLIMMDIGIS